ncbi:E3 ubiquitin-protein ligase UBR1 [Geosmithia morbida]|uniref:E3 ubiquitin-protein ligase n=1 Tax=Geosmithia morbida TaxID=1094350 RepID=A0A9P5D0A7_9HYPO|nr:E3 ubiquitin-protein ligase UBR1 [Geosmithia morbida]KAF4122538.1 E3 ubiquitin-protein ligase UBR1 [Geosmithia morbida]
MEQPMSSQEQQLCQLLADLPAQNNYRYTDRTARTLIESLFWFLAGGKSEYMQLLFPSGRIPESGKLSDAQGAVEGAEYTETARGKRCGHIFKAGEASYACRTCGTDETCCLCARCFDSTDHTGHMVRMHISVGNSGCCDCGDDEAWRTPLFCTIHSDAEAGVDKGKGKAAAALPDDLVTALRMTIARVFDYMCDVISCSPEQLREAKTVESVLKDEETSRLSSRYLHLSREPCEDFSLVLWNDEKHTVQEVQDQVARACKKRHKEALQDAWDTDAIGRSILKTMTDVEALLGMAKVMEAIRITVTIRSARDTFREQMCGTIVEWLGDIAGCAVGQDSHILRQIVCEELMRPWRQGSQATHTAGLIDDEDEDDQELESRLRLNGVNARFLMALRAAADTRPVDFEVEIGDDDNEDDDEVDDDEDDGIMIDDDGSHLGSSVAGDDEDGDEDVMMVDSRDEAGDLSLNWSQPDQALEEDEATMAGYPPPPPPPAPGPGAPATAAAGAVDDATTPAAAAATAAATAATAAAAATTPRVAQRERDATPSDSDAGAEPLIAPAIYAKANVDIPKTPGKTEKLTPKPGKHWIETPAGYTRRDYEHPAEDVFQRVRLDWLLLFDPRMWKKVRIDLRSLYISTVVQVPEFKRLLALRFSSMYTVLAQIYLVGDREPDHSIINLSLQMLTTPSITAEIVERGNFMSSLFAIVYTFLTTRQVGHPWDVSPDAVLAFESGSVTNRRMLHFYQDLKYLFGSPHVQERIRYEPRYLMQFLDLVKLHQGVGPNVRAVVEHVEYEADAWITASLVTRQINIQARSLSEAFRGCPPEDMPYLQRAIRFTAKTVILNSVGSERHRFKQAEIKDVVKFKTLDDFEFDASDTTYKVVNFVVQKGHVSFHHALHYTLSWLVECARSLPASTVKGLLSFTAQELQAKPKLMGKLSLPKQAMSSEDYLMAAFDYPLRVCAWLAQIKANMWVRNGISLRHQAGTYRGVGQRDVSHHRDIFLLQTAMVVCDPARVLASVIDRFGMDLWVKGLYEVTSQAQDDAQHLDVVEDMLHLLIVLLSDRTILTVPDNEPDSRLLSMRRDLIHVLCFKPLSFNEICNKLPEKYQESEDFQEVLDEMATFKPPEGISDVGTFELRQEFIEEIDPYIAHYNKNQREESETAYRKKMAKKTGKSVEEVVYEPKPRPITSGLFEDLSAFTRTGPFAQIIYYCLMYPLTAHQHIPSIPSTRLETFLQVILHLMLLAIHEDRTTDEEDQDSFVHIALTRPARVNAPSGERSARTIVALLNIMSSREEFKSAHPKIYLVLKRLKQKRPVLFDQAFAGLGIPVDRVNTSSPAVNLAEEERERRKKAALSRQAKVMAQFQQQQKSFMDNQADIDWVTDAGEDNDDDDDARDQAEEERKHTWKYPTGTCILCQEEADDRRLYGTFTLLNESHILRQTDFQDQDFVREASQTPCNLDRSAEDLRPFGIAHENRHMVEKVNKQGETFLAERQVVGKGYPASTSRPGPVATGCGHMMHYRCFEVYCEATNRRHTHQIARHHPEDTRRNEFVCPLCKALGNAFLPIVWKGVEESYPGCLLPTTGLDQFIDEQLESSHWLRATGKGTVVGEQSAAADSPWLESLVDAIGEATGAVTAAAAVPDTSAAATPQANPNAADGSMAADLRAAYKRLRNTLRSNGLKTRHVGDAHKAAELPDELCCSDTLVQVVGFTISSVEIQQRGIEAQPGLTLLDRVPEQTLTHLRILSETVSSYISIGVEAGGDAWGRMLTEFQRDSERQHCQLFICRYFGVGASHARRPMDTYPPLLSLDPFIFLVECTYGLVPAHKADVAHTLRLCYLAELVKVVFHMARNMPLESWAGPLRNRRTQDPAMNNFAEFALEVTRYAIEFDVATLPTHDDGFEPSNTGFQQPGVDTLEGWYTFVKKYALTFLRKSVLLLNVKFGVDFTGRHVSTNPDADELDRLTEALRVPSFDEMCAALTPSAQACGWPAAPAPAPAPAAAAAAAAAAAVDAAAPSSSFSTSSSSSSSSTISTIVAGWIRHQILWPRERSGLEADDIAAAPGAAATADPVTGSGAASRYAVRYAPVSHPGIFELVGLPKTYDTLIEEATRRRCPTTGKDLMDPVICLFCGVICCSQGTCCQKTTAGSGLMEGSRIGGAQQHMQRCQGNIGVFLNIRKCATVYLFRLSGSFAPAPYIDKYGETDPQLRHGRQLFLNQKRYDSMIRNTVLNHGVPSLISRRLEAEINNGGWDTL